MDKERKAWMTLAWIVGAVAIAFSWKVFAVCAIAIIGDGLIGIADAIRNNKD